MKLNHTMLTQMISHIQNTGTDQVLIFLPSNGPNGSILNSAPSICIPPSSSRSLRVYSRTEGLPGAPRRIDYRKQEAYAPKHIALLTGPARAILPNCSLVVLPATITAPGAMKTIHR